MKHKTLEYLICPGCLPEENSLRLGDCRIADGEIVEGNLECGCCGSVYPVREGIACLVAKEGEKAPFSVYETPEVLSTYLWTHYADLFGDPDASGAYTEWAAQIEPVSGAVLDTGCAVGRFSFEMSAKCDLVIGVDLSMSFVATAGRILRERQLTFSVKEEGMMGSEKSFRLRPKWNPQKVDFVAADATALPFRSGSFGCVASLNVIDKTPRPLEHVRELCRAARAEDAQLFLTDPFSWSEAICAPEKWLGGVREGRFAGAGLDNIARLISEGGELPACPSWKIGRRGAVWWKIRNHRNHFELIRSQFLKAQR